MKNLILAFSILFMGYSASGQITDPTYKTKIKTLMDIQMGQGLIIDEMMKQITPNIPTESRAEFKKEFEMIMDKSMDKIADVQMEVFTKEEVDALLEFYNSPIGQQIQKKLPQIMMKTSKMQQELTMELMPIMQKYIK